MIQHPDAIQATARRYGLIEGQASSTAGAMLQTFDAGAMLARYLNFFKFDFLFRLGDTYLPFSTRNTGVFVGGAGLLMAAGIYAALTTYRSAITIAVLLGFLLSPVAASILLDEGAIRRATGMLPFGALLAGLGAAQIARMARVPFFKPMALDGGRCRHGGGRGRDGANRVDPGPYQRNRVAGDRDRHRRAPHRRVVGAAEARRC